MLADKASPWKNEFVFVNRLLALLACLAWRGAGSQRAVQVTLANCGPGTTRNWQVGKTCPTLMSETIETGRTSGRFVKIVVCTLAILGGLVLSGADLRKS